MACKGCLECLLKLLNFLLTLVGLAMIGFGIYLFVEYTRADDNVALVSTLRDGQGLTQLGRPMLMTVSLSDNILDKLPKAWYVAFFFSDFDLWLKVFVLAQLCLNLWLRNLLFDFHCKSKLIGDGNWIFDGFDPCVSSIWHLKIMGKMKPNSWNSPRS